jgi:two-component system, NtrC family, sensor kinase
MKKFITIVVIIVSATSLNAQEDRMRSFLSKLENAKDDKSRVDVYAGINFAYMFPDSAFVYALRGVKLAQSIGYVNGEMWCRIKLAESSWVLGDFESSINLSDRVLNYAISVNDTNLIFTSYGYLVNSYRDLGEYKEALRIINSETFKKYSAAGPGPSMEYAFIADTYNRMGNLDSAHYYINRANSVSSEDQGGWINLVTGQIMDELNRDSIALVNYRKSIIRLKRHNNFKDLVSAYNGMAKLFDKNELVDSVLFYANEALQLARNQNFNRELIDALIITSKTYEKNNPELALNYFRLAIEARDSLYNQESQQRITAYKFNKELRQQEIKTKELEYKSRSQRLWIFSIAGALFSAVLILLILFRNNKNKQKINAQLKNQKEKAEQTLEQLKATQSQLIQSEKMASLGELTAGIAHEIQNPLNFVNNFSELSNELIDEMNEELAVGNMQLANEIAGDIKQNLQKINHHGKRAADIVKGMLLHSRTSNGTKEPTDINALADEYLRLSYHGLRAKDKTFNADFKLEADERIPKINVIPQDIGRVLLNLINNAFYAVQAPPPPEGGIKETQSEYKPQVTVKTSYLSPSGGTRGAVCISVSDNGPGIPPHIIDKIFQPFFTTKPTGQGTGLGLSLSYDIVKAHGGELSVRTPLEKLNMKMEEGTMFTITLPLSQ